ncbi:unnamed protein product [Timema podura]|uniref:NSFL1 cofactor p47 n=1 Tax=Timema podura TaxID=61482 RepID=A0ABN7NLA9_TIMPD|nr:unnamed protein product [Timema podura]
MSDSNKPQLLSQFTDVTGVDEERARFYLESSAWQLEVALASFYENDGDDNPIIVEDTEPEGQAAPPPSPVPVLTDSHNKQKPKPKQPAGYSSRIATVAGLNSDTSDEEEGQAFYAGGSEHSGQQVLGPSKKKDIVSEMFKSVKE